jgi:Arc/MetJ-type ribon-helix-helix transcriptional regulator
VCHPYVQRTAVTTRSVRAQGRFTDEQPALIDELVDSGIAESRSAVVRRGVHDLAESVRRTRVGSSIAASYRAQPQTPEDDELAMASALAMTEAEPW